MIDTFRLRGDAASRVVTLNERTVDPRESQRLRNHSPDGFAWGYGGSGPSQLALAVLLAAGLSPIDAERHYQAFKWEYIAKLPEGQSFEIEVDFASWLKMAESARTAQAS